MHQETTASFPEQRPANLPTPLLDTMPRTGEVRNGSEKDNEIVVQDDDFEVYNLPHTD